MTVYIGVDFHTSQQTLSYLTTEDGEIHRCRLEHKPDEPRHENVRQFYSQLDGKVIVGLETGGHSQWFEDMLEELGHEVWVGDAAQIRALAVRKQKNDKLDADHILALMVTDRFPKLVRRCRASCEVLRQIGYRHKIVKMRTMAKNNLQSIANNGGLTLRHKLHTERGRAMLEGLNLSSITACQANELIRLIDFLTPEVERVETWLAGQAADDRRVALLRSQYGVGLLTSLALIHTLEPVGRFANGRKVTAYAGLDPVENSSNRRKQIGPISKAGSRILRFLLCEAAQVAIKKDQGLLRLFNRVTKRRNRQKAVVAVARKLLVRSFILLRDQIDLKEFHRRGVEARSSRKNARPQSA